MSYRGLTIPFPVGQQGFTGTENPTQAGPGHLLYVDGVELDAGIIRKEGGATKFNATAVDGGAAIISGINWSPLAATHRDVIFTSTGKILKDTGGGTFGVTMASGLSAVRDPAPLFVVGGGEVTGEARKLFCFSSSNQVQVAIGDAGTMAAISTPPADWSTSFPTVGIVHDFRMWGAGNGSDPHRLYYSALDNQQAFTSGAGGGTLSVFPGEGDGISGLVSFRGALIVFKYPKGIYVVDTSNPTPANWSVKRMTLAVGTLSQHTIITIENDVLYADAIGGLHALSTTQEYGDYTSSDIGEADKVGSFLRTATNASRLRRSQGVWYPRKQQAWLSLPLLGSEDNGLRFITVFEPPAGGNSLPTRRFFMSRRDTTCSSMWLRPDAAGIPRPAIGDTSGFIWNLDQDARNKGGVSYPLIFETANTDFGFYDQQIATKAKSGQFLELTYEPRGSWDLTVQVFWDDVLTDTILFNMGQSGAALGDFTLDTHVLASSVVRSKRQRMAGSGRRLRLVGENSGLNQDVSLASFHVSLLVADERDA